MASSVSGVNSNSMNSIYGNRNVISGLASGMDTESMIENAVSGINARITALQQKRTTSEWKQEAMRGVIEKLVKFTGKYASYTSSTNLFSSSFFNSSVLTSALGVNASKVSATGKTSSTVTVDDIKALASAASKSVTSNLLGGSSGVPTITGSADINLEELTYSSAMSGSMTLTYGSKTISLDFARDEIFTDADGKVDAKALTDAINKKLKDEKITTSGGDTKPANEMIKAELGADGKISFSDISGGGNSVFISGATGDFSKTFELKDASTDKPTSIDTTGKTLRNQTMAGEYLSGQEMKITLDGKTKTIKLPTFDKDAPMTEDAFAKGIQAELDKAFGAGTIKLSRVDDSGAEIVGPLISGGRLQFTTKEGSSMSIESQVGSKLGLGASAASYIDMSKTLGDISGLSGGTTIAAVGKVTEKNGVFTDEKGNVVIADPSDSTKYVRAGKDGKTPLLSYDMEINGVKINGLTSDSSLESVMLAINSNTEAGVKVSYSKITNQFQFTAQQTGANNGIEITGGLGKELFGEINAKGTDAVFTMSVNGKTYDNVTRSDNTFDVDGLKVTLKETFNGRKADGTLDAAQQVTFSTKTDSDKIVTAIKDMVNDYNEMMKAIKTQYGTLPAQKSNGTKYSPLTDEDKSGMSESSIEAYEEKAKQGILFGDRDLSSLYGKLRGIFSPSGADGGVLRSMGINTEYSATEGTVVKLDESKLRAMLETNPDAVKDAFTKSKENGAPTNGIMASLKTNIDQYANTTSANKGILIDRAGSPLAPISILDNSMKKDIDNIDTQIERWQTKLSDKVDLYTRKFSQLEQLIAQMNSQSSSLMGMMGGTG